LDAVLDVELPLEEIFLEKDHVHSVDWHREVPFWHLVHGREVFGRESEAKYSMVIIFVLSSDISDLRMGESVVPGDGVVKRCLLLPPGPSVVISLDQGPTRLAAEGG